MRFYIKCQPPTRYRSRLTLLHANCSTSFRHFHRFLITYVYSTLFLLFFRIVLLIILIILFLRLNTSLLESSKLKNDSCRHGVSATASKSSFGSGRICLISAKCHILITYLSLVWKAASYVAFVKCLYLVTGVTWAAEFPQTAMDAIFIDVPADPVTT